MFCFFIFIVLINEEDRFIWLVLFGVEWFVLMNMNVLG